MRMRRKPNLLPRMERCSAVHVKNPQDFRGRWLENAADYNGLYLEIGCGKGQYTCALALENPNMLIVAVEKVQNVMVIAMERAIAAELSNVRFVSDDAARLSEIFAPGEVSGIFINFCDPWPNGKQAKRRLTSGGFLRLYREILTPGGRIFFKTDNAPLFRYSLSQFENFGFSLSEVTNNLHQNGEVGIMTDYEQKFHEAGVPICRCVATKEM